MAGLHLGVLKFTEVRLGVSIFIMLSFLSFCFSFMNCIFPGVEILVSATNGSNFTYKDSALKRLTVFELPCFIKKSKLVGS